MNQPIEVSGQILQYRLEIRDAEGELIKILIGDAVTNTVTAEYPDGRKEIIGAFN